MGFRGLGFRVEGVGFVVEGISGLSFGSVCKRRDIFCLKHLQY